VVELVRTVLGRIDLDPASNAKWNETVVRATTFYDKAGAYAAVAAAASARGGVASPALGSAFGPARPWRGRVFLNPPGGRCDRQGWEVITRSKTTLPCVETGACGFEPGHVHDGCESSQKLWWFQLAAAWLCGQVESAVFVCFSVELVQTTQVDAPAWDTCLERLEHDPETRGGKNNPFLRVLPTPLDFPVCYPRTRLAYLRVDGSVGTSPPHASCLVYLPPMHRGERKSGAQGAHAARFRAVFGELGKVVVPQGDADATREGTLE
jgi:hypothetical protein